MCQGCFIGCRKGDSDLQQKQMTLLSQVVSDRQLRMVSTTTRERQVRQETGGGQEQGDNETAVQFPSRMISETEMDFAASLRRKP